MGKSTGFIEFQRQNESIEPVAERLKHYHEFVFPLPDAEVSTQAARCMDCGVPFCMTGCPLNNLIPDWNDLVYRAGDANDKQQLDLWQQALEQLHATNNFPEFTGRLCPAPCEAACTLNINQDAVSIKSIEHALIDKGWEMGWVVPQLCAQKSGKQIVVVGSGPAGLACAQQLARAGHSVTVLEKQDKIGGLLRYGIPDFKMEKKHIDKRVLQMQAEGVMFKTSTVVDASKAQELLNSADAIVIAGGAEQPRNLEIPGRDLRGIHFAMEFLPQQNRWLASPAQHKTLDAKGKHVVVIGGGDTGSDCMGTSHRQGALSVTQLELMPQPPEQENKMLTWPNWPVRMRTSSSQEEGGRRDWSVLTKGFKANQDGHVSAVQAARVVWQQQGGQSLMQEIPGSEFEIPADLVLLAMGFTAPRQELLNAFGVVSDARGNILANTQDFRTSIDKVFAAGDARRGQSLVVWAIKEGRDCANAVNQFLSAK